MRARRGEDELVPEQVVRNRHGFRGVRRRPWGSFAAEIRDATCNKRRCALPCREEGMPQLRASLASRPERSDDTAANQTRSLTCSFLSHAHRWIGTYATAREAAEAYDAAAIALHGLKVCVVVAPHAGGALR